MNEQYILGSDNTEQTRLLEQGELLEQQAATLLDKINIQPGWKVLDNGCGSLGIVHLLAQRVGDSGEVIGLERERDLLDTAQAEISRRNLNNVRFIQGDARESSLPKETFDFIHERLLLMVSPEREQILEQMVQLARPGAFIALEDFDLSSMICYPAHPAWEEMCDAHEKLYQKLGLNRFLGRRLPELLRNAGLEDIQFNVSTQQANGQRFFLRFFSGLRDIFFQHNIIEPQRFARIVQEMEVHCDHPDTIEVLPLLCQAWGRKPG